MPEMQSGGALGRTALRRQPSVEAALFLAVVSYFVFDPLAAPLQSTGLPLGNDPIKALPAVMMGSVKAGLAMALKFIAPTVCVVAAIASFFARSQREKLLAQAQEMGAVSSVSD